MSPVPITRYRTPAYPLRAAVVADPDLLRRHMPPAWIATRDLAGAVALLLAADGSARGEDAKGGPAPAAAVVAPIFEHGEGRGATGCIVVSPPAFLSEEEAMEVIAGELKKAGVNLSNRSVEFEEIRFPPAFKDSRRAETIAESCRNMLSAIDKQLQACEKGLPRPAADGIPLRKMDKMSIDDLKKLRDRICQHMRILKERSLIMDALDEKGRIAVEFVSGGDHLDLGGEPSDSTVTAYDLRGIAGSVANKLREKGRKMHVGLFYDPLSRWTFRDRNADVKEDPPKEVLQQRMEEARARSLDLLREQVKDFVDWLKAQGAI